MGKKSGLKLASGVALLLVALGLAMIFYGFIQTTYYWGDYWDDWTYCLYMFGYFSIIGLGTFLTIYGITNRKK